MLIISLKYVDHKIILFLSIDNFRSIFPNTKTSTSMILVVVGTHIYNIKNITIINYILFKMCVVVAIYGGGLEKK